MSSWQGRRDPRDVFEPSGGGGAAGTGTPRVTGSSADGPGTAGGPAGGGGDEGKRFLRLWFSCANAYARAYPTKDGTEYAGRCPTCGKWVHFPIGPGGTGRRLFEVTCR